MTPLDDGFLTAMSNPSIGLYGYDTGEQVVGYSTYSTLSMYTRGAEGSDSIYLDGVVNIPADRMVVPVVASGYGFEKGLISMRTHEVNEAIKKAEMIVVSKGDEDLDPSWRIM